MTRQFGSCLRLGSMLIAGFVAFAGHAQNATSSLVSYWSLDASSISGTTVNDTWGSNNGEINGDPSVVAGRMGEGLMFGGDDYVRFAPYPMTGGITITAWANPASWTPAAYSEVLDTWAPGADTHWYRLGFDNTGLLEFVADTGNAVGARESVTYDASALSGWQHLAGVRDMANSQLLLYVNGEQVAATAFLYSTEVAPQNLTIGARGDGTAEFFTGVIDEVALFESSLTQAEIRSIMDSGISNTTAVSPHGKTAAAWGAIKSQ